MGGRGGAFCSRLRFDTLLAAELVIALLWVVCRCSNLGQIAMGGRYHFVVCAWEPWPVFCAACERRGAARIGATSIIITLGHFLLLLFCLTPGTTKGCFEEEEAARPCSPALFSCCVGSAPRDPALGTAPSLSPRQPLGSPPSAAAPSSPFLPHLSIHVPQASRKGQVCSARAWPLVSVGLPESPSPFCLVPPVSHLVPWFPRWTGSGRGEQTRGGQGQGWDSL